MYAPLNNNYKLMYNQVRSDCEMRIICGIAIVTSTYYIYMHECDHFISQIIVEPSIPIDLHTNIKNVYKSYKSLSQSSKITILIKVQIIIKTEGHMKNVVNT